MGGASGGEWIHVCVWLSPFAVHLKLSQHSLLVSYQFSYSVMSYFLRPHGLQHARLPCPSPIHGACSNSCPLSWWCHPTISSSVTLFSSCPQSFPASRYFPVSWLFTSGGQSIVVSASINTTFYTINTVIFPLGKYDQIITQLRSSKVCKKKKKKKIPQKPKRG